MTTYAISWIDQGVTRAIADKGFTIRMPVHTFEKINKLNIIYRDADMNGLSYNETRNLVMQKMNVDREQIIDIVEEIDYRCQIQLLILDIYKG